MGEAIRRPDSADAPRPRYRTNSPACTFVTGFAIQDYAQQRAGFELEPRLAGRVQ